MKLELTGSAHGAKPIPLVYWDDLRSAWYHVSKGTTLNEEGEKDPYPQAFIVLKGKGRLELEGLEVEVKPQNTYYIPRNSLHKVHADEDVELIWLAWKAPMF
jgi:quercetin dioxygenase-like cupin family protein